MSTLAESASARWSTGAATIAIVAAATSALSLVALHVLSPEFEVSWRMVSEYANGRQRLALDRGLHDLGRVRPGRSPLPSGRDFGPPGSDGSGWCFSFSPASDR